MAPCPQFVTKASFINKLSVQMTIIITYESAETETVTIEAGNKFEKQRLYTHEGGWTAVDPIEKVKFLAMDCEESITMTAKYIEVHQYTVENKANGVGFDVKKVELDD